MNVGPIYIAGLERSGTSLMYALLASHPRIAMTRRTNMWTYFYNRYGDLSQPAQFDRCLRTMMRYKRLVKLQPDPPRIRREFAQGEPTYARLFALIEQHHAERLGKPRWGDKSLNTERYAKPIFAAHPDAKMLHMVRDPRDRYASVIARWKSRRGGIGAGTGMWLSSVHRARQNETLFPQNYMIVRYESLVASPEQTLRQICDFLGESFCPEMLTMQGAESFREAGSNSSYGQRKPGVISTDSTGRYRQVLSQRQIAFVQAMAHREMVELNYPLDAIQFALGEQLRYFLADRPVNLARLAGWRTINAFHNHKGRTLPAYRIVSEVTSSPAC